MRRALLFALPALLIALAFVSWETPTQAAETNQAKNLVRNGMFERWVAYDNVIVGENWATWVITGAPVFNRHGHEPGQQIMSERGAFHAGVYQEIANVKPGHLYYGYVGTASLYWGNTEGKFEEVGRTIGIDPTGGTDPRSPNVVWGNMTWANKRWQWKDDPNQKGPKVRVVAQATKMTVFLRVIFNRGDNLAQAWFQDAAVFAAEDYPRDVALPDNPLNAPPVTGGPMVTVTPPVNPASLATPAPAPAPSVATVATPGPTAAPPATVRPRRPEPDYALASVAGRFFTQTAKDGQGYSVADRGTDRDGRPTRWWSEFVRLGGLDALGYPISRVYTGQDGFLYQAFQRGLLQWRPEIGRAVLANTLDFLADAGADDWAFGRSIPRQIKDDGSNGDFAKAVETRLGWLTEPAIARRYRQGPDPVGQPAWSLDDSIALYGLPSSRPEKFGPFIVQRFQRVAFQYWVEDVPGMPARGAVVPMLVGDVVAEAGLVPASARVAELPPD